MLRNNVGFLCRCRGIEAGPGLRLFHATSRSLNDEKTSEKKHQILVVPKTGKARQLIRTVNNTVDETANPNGKNWRDNESIPQWKRQKLALKEKLDGERWNSVKKLSREQMETVRMMKRQFPNMNSGDIAQHMKVSPEVIRRILKSKWQPTEQEQEDIQRRWKKRSDKILDLYKAGQIQDYTGIIPVPKRLVIGSNLKAGAMNIKKFKRNHKQAVEFDGRADREVDKDLAKAKKNLHLLMKK